MSLLRGVLSETSHLSKIRIPHWDHETAFISVVILLQFQKQYPDIYAEKLQERPHPLMEFNNCSKKSKLFSKPVSISTGKNS